MASLSQNIRVSKINQYINIRRNVAGYAVANFSFLVILFFCLIGIRPVHSQSVSAAESRNNESISLGLLITESPSEDLLMQEAVDVVNLVLDKVNKSGGIREKDVRLFIKSVDGTWGAGSKRAVSLISEYGVTALLGFVDGRSAHLIEQVCTKAQVPFISTFSPDPTLSRINISWFFSTMPHADQQSKVLADEIYKNYSENKIAVVSSDDYDQAFIKRSFIQEVEEKNNRSPKVFTFPAGKENIDLILSDVLKSDAEAIAFFGSPEELNELTSQLDFNNIKIPVYTPIIDLDNNQIKDVANTVFSIKSSNRSSEREEKFKEDFYSEYGYRPGLYASYLYDGTIALVEAIRTNGAENFQIQEALIDMNFPGINGTISFDDTGMVKSELMIVNND